MNRKEFTWLYEFKDKKLEQEYFRDNLTRTKPFFSILFFIYIIAYLSFSVLDLKLADNDTFAFLLLNRWVSSLLSFTLLYQLYKSTSSVMSLKIINMISIVIVGSFLIAIFQYHNPDYFYIEALSILTLSYALFTLPASSLIKITVSGSLNVGFFVSMLVLRHTIDSIMVIVVISCFLLVNLMINVLVLFQSNYIKRNNFKDNKQLELLSSTDYLTGVLNRNKFMALAETAVNEYNIKKCPLTFIYVDFDGFKSINDKFGHETGDKVLFDVANIIKNNLSEGDVFGRFGGDEFGILLIDSDLKKSNLKVNDIKADISGYSIKNKYLASCTFGFHQIKPGEDVKKAIHLADIDMYKNKPNY